MTDGDCEIADANEDEDEDFGFEDDDDADFGDDDDADFGDDGDGDDDWGDVVEQGDAILRDPEQLELEMKNKENESSGDDEDLSQRKWKCLECEHENTGAGLLCLGCSKPNLGEVDRQKNKRVFKEAKFWTNIYNEVYLPLQYHLQSGLDLEKQAVTCHLRSIFEHEMIERRNPDLKKYDESSLKSHCESCTLEFDQKEVERLELKCHANICHACTGSWIKSKIGDEGVLPFIRCPAEDCDFAIPLYIFLDAKTKLKPVDLFSFVAIYTEKHLARNSNFVFCSGSKCKYGWLLKMAEDEREVECENCSTKQVCKKATEFDEGFSEMMKNGKIRMCPKCEYPHMKDFGLCNVLQCGKCKIWWNWNTRDMAPTQKGLKEDARRNKTLWEPGELEYQQKLQRDDLPAFKALLAQNGIKYDPNYVRGR
jgi:hypothetical protein